MRGIRQAAGLTLFLITLSTLLILVNFRQKLLSDGGVYIASELNSHLQTDRIQNNKGRIVDRDNLAWPARQSKSMDMLLQWKSQEDAKNMYDSLYDLLYDRNYGIANLKSLELLGMHKGVFNAKDGISALYTKKGNDIYITVSGVFNEALYKAIKTSDAESGEAVLINYETGEILGWTSFPPGSLSSRVQRLYNKNNTIEALMSDRVTYISTIANNAKTCRPYIISRIISREDNVIIENTNPENPKYLESTIINITPAEALNLKTFMKSVCGENGLAADLGSNMKKKGFTAAADIGFEEIPQNAEYLNENVIKINMRTVSWISCFLEEKPFALVVELQNVKKSSIVIKIAGEILQRAIDLNLDSPQFLDGYDE